MKIFNNRLLLAMLAAVASFWVAGAVLPDSMFSPVVNLLLVVAAGLIFLRYAPDAAAILFRGRRNDQAPEGDGAHLAILGTAAIGLGGVMAAATAFMLVSPTLRTYIADTPAELFGRAVASLGMALIFISPNVSRRGIRFTGGVWMYLLAAIVLAAIYGLGYSAGFQDNAFIH